SCLSPLTGSAETYRSLPPPPSAAASQQQQNYMLGLVVNGEERDQVVPVQFQNGHYLLRAADLQRAGIPTARITASIIDVSAMDQ
ncbi:fimbrial biogenesis outer membrane usher protein, partial [Erwinia aphidicola]